MNKIKIILSSALWILRKILLFILIIFGLWFSYNLIIHSGKDQCGIVGNRVDIGAPVLIMRVVNGKPDSIRGYGEYARVDYSYDNVALFGQSNSNITYSFIVLDIREIHASIPTQAGGGEEMLHTVAESMKKEYEGLHNFTCVEKDDYVAMQSMDGACSFTIELALLEDHLSIDIVDFQ